MRQLNTSPARAARLKTPRWQVKSDIDDHTGIPRKERLVIKRLWWHGGDHGVSFPFQATVAKAIGCNRRTVIRAVATAVENGWLRVEKRGRHSAEYIWAWSNRFGASAPTRGLAGRIDSSEQSGPIEAGCPSPQGIGFHHLTFKQKPQCEPETFYWSDQWRRLRYKALSGSNGCCCLCGSRPERGKPLHVDHIKPRSLFPELELDLANVQVLCFDCNMGKGNRDEIDWRE